MCSWCVGVIKTSFTMIHKHILMMMITSPDAVLYTIERRERGKPGRKKGMKRGREDYNIPLPPDILSDDFVFLQFFEVEKISFYQAIML